MSSEWMVHWTGRITIRNRKFLRKFTPVYKPERRSNFDDLKFLPTGTSSDHDQSLATPATLVDPPSTPAQVSTPPPSVDQHLLTAPPCSPGPPSQPPTMTPTVLSPPSVSPSPVPDIPLQLPHTDPTSPPTNLRHSSRIRKPPKWQTSGDYVLY